MRHKVFGNQLGRNTKQAKALYRGLAKSLFLHGRIQTTLAKAKSAVPMVDRVITFAKKNNVSARREVAKILGGVDLIDKIFNEIGPRFANRNSGFSRIIRLSDRLSDSTKLAILELVEGEPKVETVVKVKETKKKVVSKKKLTK